MEGVLDGLDGIPVVAGDDDVVVVEAALAARVDEGKDGGNLLVPGGEDKILRHFPVKKGDVAGKALRRAVEIIEG